MSFDLKNFLPYLLNQAADASSLDFQRYYKGRYGMLRTEWRVLFHLGRYGDLTATQICDRARIHKTKVSRAVSALEKKRFLTRETLPLDKRQEHLRLTVTGRAAFKDLTQAAQTFDAKLMEGFTMQEVEVLRTCLRKIGHISND